MAKLAGLRPLVGRWATTITMIHPPKVKGEVYRAIDTYRWLPGELILVHEVEARMGEEAVNSIEMYFSKDGKIRSRNFDSKGGVSDYAASMAKGVWRVEGDTERFTSSSISEVAIEGLWQLRKGDAWKDWMTVRLDRIT